MRGAIKNNIFILLLSLLSLLNTFVAKAAYRTIIYDDEQNLIEMGKYAQTYLDDSNQLSFEEVSSLPNSAWQQSERSMINFGNSSATLWLSFNIENKTNNSLFLRFPNGGIHHIDTYSIGYLGDMNKGAVIHQKIGSLMAFYQRFSCTNSYIIPIDSDTKRLFISIKSPTLCVPIMMGAIKPLSRAVHYADLTNGLFFGALLIMAFYNLFLFFSIKERIYLIYVGYVLSSTTVVGISEGLAFELFWPDKPNMNESYGFMMVILFIFAALFTIEFLQTKKYMPTIHKIFFAIIIVLVLLIPLDFMPKWQPINNIINQCIFLLSAILFIVRNVKIITYNSFVLYICNKNKING